MKVVKTSDGYKLTKDVISFFSWLNPFYKPNYIQVPKNNSRPEPPRDLVFKTKENAEFYVETLKLDPDSRPSFKYRLEAGKCQLQAIFDHAQINPHDYTWADLWAGSGLWSLILLSITNKKVLLVDYMDLNLEYGVKDNPLIDRQSFDTINQSLSTNITGAFLRSGISDDSILKMINKNHNLDLFIVVPEGLMSNENHINHFNERKIEYQKYFNYVEIINLFSDFCIKGSDSQHVRVNGQFPVYILKDRKK